MTLRRRTLAGLAAMPLVGRIDAAVPSPPDALAAVPAVEPRTPVLAIQPLPPAIATFTAGVAGQTDLARWLVNDRPKTRLRLRANTVAPGTSGAADMPPVIPLQSQYPELSLDGRWLRYDGGAAASTAVGASAVRLQIEASDNGFNATDAAGIVVSDIATIQVDTPLAQIRHGLDRWSSFDALTRAVMGDAPAGSAPRGRVDLIGSTFELSPGMLSDSAERPAPVAVLQFPCTIRALDANDRPVLRSASGRRDIVQVQALALPPIDGEVVLQDLVIRDNRAWYDSGEAGVRIKDRFGGRSVRIERCEFVRCQNAVAGGDPGQTLRIIDCRIVDCGVGGQAHAVYVQPQRLEFFGNLVLQSPGNRLARAHLLKSRAMVSRILGNRFVLNDCPGSYLIDIPNGGEAEIGGNLLHYGSASDNSSATLVAYSAEGARGDLASAPPRFAAGRRFSLVARNNTLRSDFPGDSRGFVIDRHIGLRSEGGQAATDPDPLLIADNTVDHAGALALVIRRDRGGAASEQDRSADFGDNSIAQRTAGDAAAPPAPRANSAGPYAARRFTGSSALGTGSVAHTFRSRGAG